MPHPAPPDAATAALARIEAPAAAAQRRAALLATAAALGWAAQAALVAWAIAGWLGGAGVARSLSAGAGFALVGALRALLVHRAGGIVFRAADAVLAAERAALIARESRRAPGTGPASAALGALAAQKLPLLVPYLTRYRPARLRATALPLAFLALTFAISWAAGLILLVAGPLIPIFMALVGMAAREASAREMVAIGALNGLLIDRLSALVDIRLLDATDRTAAGFATRAETLRARTMAVLRIAFLSSTVLELFSALGIAMVAVYVGFTLLGQIGFGTWRAPLSVGHGIFLLLLAPEFFLPLRDLAAAWHDRAAALAVAGELAGPEAADSPPVLGQGAAVAPLPGPLTLALQRVALRRGGRLVRLPDLAVGPGESVAVTGPSGAGKSTPARRRRGPRRPGRGPRRGCGPAARRRQCRRLARPARLGRARRRISSTRRSPPTSTCAQAAPTPPPRSPPPAPTGWSPPCPGGWPRGWARPAAASRAARRGG